MKIILRLVWLAAVLAAGVWLWTVLFPGPEKVIRQSLAAIARDATSAPNQNPLVSVANAQRLGGYFSQDVEVELNLPGRLQQTFSGREEIVQTAAGVATSAKGLKVEFVDVNVKPAADKQSATAELTLKAQLAGDKDFIVQEMKIALQKTDGHWLIKRVETVRPLT
jgi:hypothetical protein